MLWRWFGATAVGQMITEKPLSVFGGQAPENNAPMFQPSPEVLDHPNTPPNPVVRVTVGCLYPRRLQHPTKPQNSPASNRRNGTFAKYVACFMPFWAHRGALWRGSAHIQIKAKLVGGWSPATPSEEPPSM
jgi:hypothetical protein